MRWEEILARERPGRKVSEWKKGRVAGRVKTGKENCLEKN